MKIALAQQNYHIGNFEDNTRKIIEGIEWAKKQKADLVVFSELCICGYPPRDFLEFNDFINKCYESLDRIRQHADTIGVLVGCPARNPQKEGKDLFNAVFLLHEQQIKAEIHKTLLPNYDVFDEYRYFEPADQWNVITKTEKMHTSGDVGPLRASVKFGSVVFLPELLPHDQCMHAGKIPQGLD